MTLSKSSFMLSYLGVAGWHLQAAGASLLIDPYFTRLPMWRVVVGRAVPDADAVARYTPPADWILVTHPHYDHLLDVPEAARLTGAPVYASPQGCALLRLLGVPATQLHAITPDDRLELGPFIAEVYEVPHRLMLGRVPYFGPLPDGLTPPLRARDYRIQQQYSFRVTAGGVRILVASGIDGEPAVEADVLLVGADASRDQLERIMDASHPQLVLPNHWDDMFRSLDKPIRPSLAAPSRFGLPRRIDLDAWQARVKAAAPGADVVVPELFADYAL